MPGQCAEAAHRPGIFRVTPRRRCAPAGACDFAGSENHPHG